MVDSSHIFFRADDRSFYSLLKKDIHKFCVDSGIDEAKVHNIDIIVAELTSNLLKHAIGGNMLVKAGADKANKYIELICYDDGPGITDLSRVMADGYSTVNTMGQGLGSIRRLSDYFDIFSLKGWGTVIVVRVFNESILPFQNPQQVFRGINIPKNGEKVSGDGYSFRETADGFKLFIGDGLGHGPDAHQAVQSAISFFLSALHLDSPTEIIRLMHPAIKKTRGCVGAVVMYNKNKKEWTYAGVGNILIKWFGEQNKTYPSYNGIIGHNIPGSINDSILSSMAFPLMIACSDGIRSNWNPGKFQQISRNDGTLLATAIFKEFTRNSDDASVIVTNCRL